MEAFKIKTTIHLKKILDGGDKSYSKCVKLTPESTIGDVSGLEIQAAINVSKETVEWKKTELLGVANLIRGLCTKQYNTLSKFQRIGSYGEAVDPHCVANLY